MVAKIAMLKAGKTIRNTLIIAEARATASRGCTLKARVKAGIDISAWQTPRMMKNISISAPAVSMVMLRSPNIEYPMPTRPGMISGRGPNLSYTRPTMGNAIIMATASGISSIPVWIGVSPRTLCRNNGSRNIAGKVIKLDVK